VEPAPAAAVEEKLAPVEAKSQPQTAPERAEVAGSTTTNEEPGQKSDRRSKRWVKAVGRFLHVTPKKDVQPEAVRQP